MNYVLFDLDGTIADTEVLKARALSESIRRLGGTAAPDLYKTVMGKSWEAVTRFFLDHAKLKSTLDELNPLFRESYSALIETELTDSRKASDVLRWFKQRDYKIALVSSSSSWMIEKVLAKLQLPVAFDVIVSNADTVKHKPDPEAYLLALSKLKASADSAIAFEDSESGFQAAHAAGIKVIGIKHSYNTSHDFKLCQQVCSSFSEYLA